MKNFQEFHTKNAMLNYGTDKPDLRNPLLINDITKIFTKRRCKI